MQQEMPLENSQQSASKTRPHDYNALESHVAFFDADGDGIIWPLDTFKGFSAVGFNVFFSLFSAIFIHISFSWITWGTILPDPFFRIRVSKINRVLHGSDSGSYTQTGELDEHRFNYIFEEFSSPPHTHMSFKEGVRMVQANRNVYDFFGWIAAVGEWGSAYLLLRSASGRVSKQDVHDILDGSLFPKLAERKLNNKKAANASALANSTNSTNTNSAKANTTGTDVKAKETNTGTRNDQIRNVREAESGGE